MKCKDMKRVPTYDECLEVILDIEWILKNQIKDREKNIQKLIDNILIDEN